MRMTFYECSQVAAHLTQIACEGDDNLTSLIKVSADGKLDPNIQAENLFVWEVYKVFLGAVIATQEEGGAFVQKDSTAPDIGGILGQLKPVLDQVLPALTGNPAAIVQAIMGLLGPKTVTATVNQPSTPTTVPPLTAKP